MSKNIFDGRFQNHIKLGTCTSTLKLPLLFEIEGNFLNDYFVTNQGYRVFRLNIKVKVVRKLYLGYFWSLFCLVHCMCLIVTFICICIANQADLNVKFKKVIKEKRPKLEGHIYLVGKPSTRLLLYLHISIGYRI